MSADAPGHEIVICTTPEDFEACLSVRIDVFVHEQQFLIEEELDECVWTAKYVFILGSDPNSSSIDPVGTHILLRLTDGSNKPVGTIRASTASDGSYYKLSRLAVLKEYRKYRFGRALVLALHDWVKVHAKESGRMQDATIVCHAQLPVKPFYERYGAFRMPATFPHTPSC
jgi:predicted GNAT family N-acyltransferase